MKISMRYCHTLTVCVAAAMLPGCGGSQPPIGATAAAPQTLAIATHADRAKSWMLPEATSEDLLYVADGQTVNVYSYPGGKLEGTLKRFDRAVGTCVGKVGNVFIVNAYEGEILEYAHGGTKPMATLHTPTKDPVGCAIDLTTGDRAVGSQGVGSAGTISIFKKARGKPTVYQSSQFYEFFFCGYDNKGNLFADGISAPGSGHFALAELLRGAATFTNIAVDQYVTFPGEVQWDGKHLAVGNQFTDIYEFAIKGHRAISVGTTRLGSNTTTRANTQRKSRTIYGLSWLVSDPRMPWRPYVAPCASAPQHGFAKAGRVC
jgi:hypothetical protein